MKLADVATICLVGGLVAGCEPRVNKQEASKKLDTELVSVLNNIGLENAIVAQHTLFPYHFIQNSDKLNELGQRDLAVLAKHFQKYPGALNIRRGDTSTELYDARVAQAVEKLKQAGVKIDRVSVSDGAPGGSGVSSERMVMVLTETGNRSPARRSTGGSGRITQ